MSKRKRNQVSRNDRDDAAKKKNGKLNIVAFILCLLIAFVIWLYASNIPSEEPSGNEKENVTVEESND